MPLFGRLIRRVDHIESELIRTTRMAQTMMSDADRTMLEIKFEVLSTLKDFAADLQDGVSFQSERTGEGSIVDFFSGKIDKVPFRLMVDVSADADDSC